MTAPTTEPYTIDGPAQVNLDTATTTEPDDDGTPLTGNNNGCPDQAQRFPATTRDAREATGNCLAEDPCYPSDDAYLPDWANGKTLWHHQACAMPVADYPPAPELEPTVTTPTVEASTVQPEATPQELPNTGGGELIAIAAIGALLIAAGERLIHFTR